MMLVVMLVMMLSLLLSSLPCLFFCRFTGLGLKRMGIVFVLLVQGLGGVRGFGGVPGKDRFVFRKARCNGDILGRF